MRLIVSKQVEISDTAAGWVEGERDWRERVAPYLLYES